MLATSEDIFEDEEQDSEEGDEQEDSEDELQTEITDMMINEATTIDLFLAFRLFTKIPLHSTTCTDSDIQSI